jgi:SAM-dependent methyltransferase
MSLEVVSCAVCRSPRGRRALTKFGLDLARCRDCGFLYASPRLSGEAIRQRYSPDYFWKEYLPSIGIVDGRYDPAFSQARYRCLLELIGREVPPPARLLEIGPGAGSFLDAARAAGFTVEGIEFSAEAAAFARDRLGLAVVQGAAEELDARGAFDVVGAFDTLEHVLQPREVLEKARAALRPGGLLALTVPNLNALSRAFLGADWAVLSPAEHLSYFTERTLGRLLREVGFEGVRFVRRFAGFGLPETMNPECTHRPGTRRQRLYRSFTRRVGASVFPWVQDRGWGDSLLCLARSPGGPHAGRARPA